ncbi:hypothetical protein ACS0TY_023044 [Phlomoides rotata]
MGDSPNKKKIVVAGLASILLVAAVVGVVVSTKSGGAQSISGSNKAVQAICSPTRYKETCEKSLSQANTTDPKKLIQLAFDATAQNIGDVLNKSALLKEAEADPSMKDAYLVCQLVLESAVDDLKRSIEHVREFDASKTREYIEDLRTWLSAVVTDQTTCVDAFEGTTGDAGEKMKKMLATARQMSINALALISDVQSIFGSLELGSSRKLLSTEVPTFAKRRLQEATRSSLQPTIVVAKDGSGQFKTLGEAIASLPQKSNDSVVIYVKEGLYEENVEFPKNVNNVMLYGDGPLKTRITGNKNFAIGGVKTFLTATVGINGEDFFAKDIAFENTAGAVGHQAVALRVSSDKAVFYNVHIDGYQDTLYNHRYRQYYRECSISGTIDFIFGNSLSLFQDCTFIVRKPEPNQGCMVTAQGREEELTNGANVIQNGNFTAEEAFLTADPPHKAYLGRPWKVLSRTIIIQSNIEGFIDPTGWAPWEKDFALDTCYYGEYQNRGPGSDTSKRVQWKGIKNITPEVAESWTGGKAFGGDEWIVKAGVPYVPTL